MDAETVRHCPGCAGYTRGWQDECPGFAVSEELGQFTVPDVVPPLGWRNRLMVLLGFPVFLGTQAGPLGEPFEVGGLLEDEPARHRVRDAS